MDRRTVLSLFAMAAVKGSVPIRGRAARTVDLTTASIGDLGSALRGWSAVVRAADGVVPGPHRGLRQDGSRIERRPAPQPHGAGGGTRVGRRASSPRPEEPAARDSGAPQGKHRRRRVAGDGRLPRAARFCGDAGRRADQTAQAGRVRDPRVDQHERVRQRARRYRRSAGRSATPSPWIGRRPGRAAAAAPRSPPGLRASRWAPTPAGRCADRLRQTASSGSGRRSVSPGAAASFHWPCRSTR